MDRNVANADSNTHKKLAQHEDRSGMRTVIDPNQPKVKSKAIGHSLPCYGRRACVEAWPLHLVAEAATGRASFRSSTKKAAPPDLPDRQSIMSPRIGKAICRAKTAAPTSQFREADQRDLGGPASPAKITRFLITPNQWFLPGCPVSTRGAFRDRHGRGMGCGGRERRARRRRPTRTAKSCGPDAAVLASNSQEQASANDGGKRAVHRGEHEVSRKATAQGRPECFR